MEQALISVIMPVYNAEMFVKEAIGSILGQSVKELELIIINDCSSDDSEAVINSFNDPRIRYAKHNKNRGAAAARNRGLDMAGGEFIVFQDADDISVPSRIETLGRNFFSGRVGLVHSDVLLIDKDVRPAGYFSNRNLEKRKALRYFFKTGSPITGASIMVRRRVFETLRYDESLKIGEDNDLLLGITRQWESVHVPEPLYLYRRYERNSSAATEYDVIFAHVHKILREFHLRDLVPEIWYGGDARSSEARACAIVSLFLFRRGMRRDAVEWIYRAVNSACSANDMHFVTGIGCMLERRYRDALDKFVQCAGEDHITENYLGECYTLTGNLRTAAEHFLKSLRLIPHYDEPLENLKALGGLSGFNLGDTTWLKLK